MMERRTRRISSSLLPLNITPAMTSIHPPAWWNGPLGPLTTGRDLYAVRPHATVGRMVRRGAAGADDHRASRGRDASRGPTVDRGPGGRVRLPPFLARHDRARRGRRPDGP